MQLWMSTARPGKICRMDKAEDQQVILKKEKEKGKDYERAFKEVREGPGEGRTDFQGK